jgi:hypothetical protein
MTSDPFHFAGTSMRYGARAMVPESVAAAEAAGCCAGAPVAAKSAASARAAVARVQPFITARIEPAPRARPRA